MIEVGAGRAGGSGGGGAGERGLAGEGMGMSEETGRGLGSEERLGKTQSLPPCLAFVRPQDADVNGDGLIDYEEFLAASLDRSRLQREEYIKKVGEGGEAGLLCGCVWT